MAKNLDSITVVYKKEKSTYPKGFDRALSLYALLFLWSCFLSLSYLLDSLFHDLVSFSPSSSLFSISSLLILCMFRGQKTREIAYFVKQLIQYYELTQKIYFSLKSSCIVKTMLVTSCYFIYTATNFHVATDCVDIKYYSRWQQLFLFHKLSITYLFWILPL